MGTAKYGDGKLPTGTPARKPRGMLEKQPAENKVVITFTLGPKYLGALPYNWKAELRATCQNVSGGNVLHW